MTEYLANYLRPTEFLDFQNPVVQSYTQQHIQQSQDNPQTKAVKLYYAVRDDFRYNPYQISLSKQDFRASYLIQRPDGYCIEKAIVLAACTRAAGIPTRLGFCNVTNHIGTSKLEEMLGTNILVFHGYVELWLNQKWVKATPAFNKQLCEKLGVTPLEFDGEKDSVFQAYDSQNTRFMEYLHDYGTFEDFPYDLMITEWKRYYGHTSLFVGAKEVGN